MASPHLTARDPNPPRELYLFGDTPAYIRTTDWSAPMSRADAIDLFSAALIYYRREGLRIHKATSEGCIRRAEVRHPNGVAARVLVVVPAPTPSLEV